MKYTIASLCTLLFLITSCKTEAPQEKREIKRGLITQKAMVVSAREEASKIGSMIMEQGGNAFDAMVATEMALAVTYPYAGNLGGGGFMVYRTHDGTIGALDYREKAPGAADKDMYLDEEGNVIPNLSTEGAMAVGVPGTISGIFAAHEKFGTMPISTLLQPVVDLARNGYVVTKKQAGRFEKYSEVFNRVNEDSTMLYSTAFAKAETVKNPALAATLERIIANGKTEFYGGETGQKMVEYLQSKGGIMTVDDLKAYEAQWRTPVTFAYDNLKIISMSPPSSGGVCLAQIMEMIEPYNVSQYGHKRSKS